MLPRKIPEQRRSSLYTCLKTVSQIMAMATMGMRESDALPDTTLVQ